MRKGTTATAAGARFADRNDVAANHFTVARSIWSMHDALLTEQRRTNQLLEALLRAQGADVPEPDAPLDLNAADTSGWM